MAAPPPPGRGPAPAVLASPAPSSPALANPTFARRGPALAPALPVRLPGTASTLAKRPKSPDWLSLTRHASPDLRLVTPACASANAQARHAPGRALAQPKTESHPDWLTR